MMMGAGYGSSLGWLGMGLGMIMHLAFAVGTILAVIWLFKAVFPSGTRTGEQPAALELVKERYAKGEITAEEYRRIKQDLE
ncbi:SHOCT domain-containing protein [Anaerospora hongkongensis]|uniref:SHOCT domain-containing protein n=1 Tax=Anaerospora hongkongensis TaxID=244830 RepID=UPI00289CA281|nr:SHOCT domain-containing protein [Anaerospora hongkongensis]